MKFGQLIEFNMRNVFLEKPHIKCVGESLVISLVNSIMNE